MARRHAAAAHSVELSKRDTSRLAGADPQPQPGLEAPSAPEEAGGNGSLEFKHVPPDLCDRQRIRQASEAEAARMTRAPSRGEVEQAARQVLLRLELDGRYLGFAMVMVANGFWASPLRAVPFSRRLLLLPRCLSHIGAAGDESPGPDGNGRQAVQLLRRQAEQLGYKVLVADGMPIVVKLLAEENVDGIVGVACMDSLEAAFEKVRRLGLPAVAVPLLRGQCKDTSVDVDWLREFVEAHAPLEAPCRSGYLWLVRSASEMFAPDRLARLLDGLVPGGPGRPRRNDQDGDALESTCDLAMEWLALGGKRLRPFVTLASAAALADPTARGDLGDEVYRVALAIEAFHKASLVHDDIEDDDDERYGQPTLHRKCGLPMAINVGDYLLGLGYRLVASTSRDCPPAVTAAILAQMSRAHVYLAQGQGAELFCRRPSRTAPTPTEMLKVYALKTSPAFEAALLSGMLLGGSNLAQEEQVRTFTRHVGVGFQILNDLSGWEEDCRSARPTYLTALALQTVPPAGREALIELIRRCTQAPEALPELRERIEALGVFRQANEVVHRLRTRAAGLAEQFKPPALADLCRFLLEVILDREPPL